VLLLVDVVTQLQLFGVVKRRRRSNSVFRDVNNRAIRAIPRASVSTAAAS